MGEYKIRPYRIMGGTVGAILVIALILVSPGPSIVGIIRSWTI